MEFFDLVNISERYIELACPSSPEKIITLSYGREHIGWAMYVLAPRLYE